MRMWWHLLLTVVLMGCDEQHASFDSAKSKEFTNSLGMRFERIPAGTFLMGSPATEKDRNDDETPHQVTITRPFFMGRTEVTQGQWKNVMGTAPWEGKDNVEDGENYPAVYIS